MPAVLVLLRPNNTRKLLPLREGVNTLGRSQDCNVYLPVELVSRRHCQITVKRQLVSLEDLGSANGTKVNGVRVQVARLLPGDTIEIASVRMFLQIDGKPADPVSIDVVPEAGHESIDSSLRMDAGVSMSALSRDEIDPISALDALDTLVDDEDDRTRRR